VIETADFQGPAIETEEVQGNVLYAYGAKFRYARYVLLEFKDRAQALAVLAAWQPKITFGGPRAPADPRGHVNVAFTHEGLKLISDSGLVNSFPIEFRQGARERSPDLGDRGDSRAENWWHKRTGKPHVLVSVHATDRAQRDKLMNELVTGVKRFWNTAAALLGPRDYEPGSDESCNTGLDREHFGFADGCSQPAIEGIHKDPVGGGIYARKPLCWWPSLRWLELLTEDLGVRRVPRQWRGIRAGEFVLGYENEDGRSPDGPPAPLGPNGTFMVYREIDQHVDRFNAYLHEKAGELDKATLTAQAGRPDTAPDIFFKRLLRAKIVGRWRDGTPLALSPDGQDPLIAANRRRANDFLYHEDRYGYRADPEGLRCPLGAHVRRTNPRDALPGGGERTMRHRMIRRGMPYGPPYDAHSAQAKRGLAFVCFSSSICNGFEFVQRQWCDGGDAFGLGQDRDLLLQQGDAKTPLTGMVIPDRNGKTIVLRPPEKPFVTVRGCEYLFVPSRRAYAWLMTQSP
jgi:Dyp-type peroxidase family